MAWSFGGDFVARSADGGLTWTVSNDGNNGIMVGHSFSLNASDPDLICLPSQDYDGALSADGGRTWRRAGLSGQGWGGWTYGGYAVGDQFYFGGRRKGGGDDDPRTLVLSRDHGLLWETVATLPNGGVRDVACDAPNHRLYAVAEGSQRLFTVDLVKQETADVTDRLVAEQMGRRGARSVAVDPADTRVVYAGHPGNYYLSDASACRSLDGVHDGERNQPWQRPGRVALAQRFSSHPRGLFRGVGFRVRLAGGVGRPGAEPPGDS